MAYLETISIALTTQHQTFTITTRVANVILMFKSIIHHFLRKV